MHKQSLKFIKSFVESEYNLFQEGIEESIIANKYRKNLFLVFTNREEVEKYLIDCCENKITI